MLSLGRSPILPTSSMLPRVAHSVALPTWRTTAGAGALIRVTGRGRPYPSPAPRKGAHPDQPRARYRYLAPIGGDERVHVLRPRGLRRSLVSVETRRVDWGAERKGRFGRLEAVRPGATRGTTSSAAAAASAPRHDGLFER